MKRAESTTEANLSDTTQQEFGEHGAQPAAIWVRRVLVVEDDEETRLNWRSLLSRRGFEVASVPDGVTALEIYDEFEPEVILLDLGLPRMSGQKLLHTLRHGRGVWLPPIVVITGGNAEEARSRLSAFGIARVMQKPCKARDLAAALREALGEE